jgi:hypothetical protein
LQSDLIESGFNPPTLSHGLSGAELTRLPLNALTSNQKSNCNVKYLRSARPRAGLFVACP